MTSPGVEAMLEEANVAVLATVDTKGRAHAAPIWYLYEDGEFLISTGRGSQKHLNVEAHPDVTLVIDRRELPYLAAMVRGKAQIEDALSDERRQKLAFRYLGEEMGRAYLKSTEGGSSVTIRLRPDKVIEFNGRAGRD
ncbi:MAG: nitroreductase family deazaflavin-dependent oxidoreductase [Chloroflexi bacterium]|nr:nitroreductase family deazaflavin-dependent oxidoreductase [Chloroflexota bacterium]